MAGDECQIHARRALRWRRRREFEVGVAVKEDQTVPTTSAQGESGAEQYAAVAANNERKSSGNQLLTHGVGERLGIATESVVASISGL